MGTPCLDQPDELTGNDADAFAAAHLKERWVDQTNWRVGYECIEFGTWWLRDSPEGHLHAGGPPRLRRVDLPEWRQAQATAE